MRVVIVNNMKEAPSAPWHPLNQSFPEMIESQSHLHDFIPRVAITRTK